VRRRGWPFVGIGWSAATLLAASVVVGFFGESLPLDTMYKRHLAVGTLQLVLLTLGIGGLAAWGAAWGTGRTIALAKRTAWVLVCGGLVAYSAGLSAMSLVRHRALLTGVWDLGYYAQLTWGLAQLAIPRSSVWYDTPWGNHATFILAAAAPILWLFPDPSALLILQSVVLAFGAVPAFCLGSRVWGSPLAGAIAAGAYLFYPPLQFSNLFDFHADTFATPALLAAFAALFAGRTAWAFLWAGVLLLVKEDMALVAVTFGLYAAFVHRRKSGAVFSVGAALAFFLLVGIVIPGWIGTPYLSLFNRWPHLGNTPLELVASPVLRPSAFWGTLLQPERLGYLVLLVTPLAGLPILAPEILAIGLPPLASNLLSATEAQYTIRAQYTATLTPILITAAVVGGYRAARWLEARGVSFVAPLAGLAAASVVASLAFSPLPWSQDPSARKQFWNAAPRQDLQRIGLLVPPDASISAANHVGAHFALRRKLELFPHGKDTADFVLVDVSGLDYVGATPNSETFRPLLRSLIDTRPLAALEDDLALFARGAPLPETVPRLARLRTSPSAVGRAAGDFALVASAITPSRLAPRELLRARYTWMATRTGEGMPCVAEAFVSGAGDVVWSARRVMLHGLLQGIRWRAGWSVEEAVAIRVPESVPPGIYNWSVIAWNGPDAEACKRPPESKDPLNVAEVRILPW
jgi:uncharacterized membrane protein